MIWASGGSGALTCSTKWKYKEDGQGRDERRGERRETCQSR